MSTKKTTAKRPAAKKAAPADAPAVTPEVANDAESKGTDPTLEAIYHQGREARRNAISRDDAPHAGGEALGQWQAGWDDQDKVLGGH